MPGPFSNDNTDDEDVTFDEVSGMADRLGLQGEKRAQYIHDHMVQLGYDAVQSRDSYIKQKPPEDQGEQGGGNRWGFGGRSQSGRQSGGNRRDNDDSF